MGGWLSDHPWLAAGGLQTLELMPLGPFVGYSMADAIVGLDGIMDMIEGAFENRHTKIARIGLGVRGIAKIGIAAAPALPVSGASVLLNRVINVPRKNT
ncbi:hypothetical protein A2631_05945 [Candidatus Daviesbacteria bacterium RIFCSPHIGHO2_01_FULL_44_29]|uniref:Uncharacterized protein n=1 Tax=Candidatus Daviesbacteria bacterium RIFCSPHIGHO2_02_FULL_43_12 TaxID=1797776 RepID=A0A1F5KJ15_9BACT|nr:MAG: hypothetical protein A2631_05945 [Candidatus Daviesbacteria bacterium RIFCSPHIGHO2_01_FULL_44_29]OGE39135.1 MAG: hypothetical protein A3E86_03275 [Candidatus Daviesbacteria bacterium RIFCSPHIGHO2_12_FULL_47_45]OGE40937.1 MAG: hypothetical protein A3D25_02775 [Candidatus Daviesbacteria bacterium RIFCSPHIGHO2_02_FULL_43_12]OGE69912.1 MAG: hypothetical protein A3B55_05895 [Candidatus Daviesbacteria bacterium RIFCSPLOWO2_01_FULL_43_15]